MLDKSPRHGWMHYGSASRSGDPMSFILFLGLTLLSGESVYQKYHVESPQECRELAIVVARQYYREGLLDQVDMLCFGGWEV